jgi:AraC-like DNA-binding protein
MSNAADISPLYGPALARAASAQAAELGRAWQLFDDPSGRSWFVLMKPASEERVLDHARSLCRTDIEHEVVLHLQDMSLTISKLAALLGCSIRTLHRVFGRECGDSLERHILRCRADACAAHLRNWGKVGAVNLTQLALQFGFSSSSHFSAAFKAQYGVSPSAYRQAHRQPMRSAEWIDPLA